MVTLLLAYGANVHAKDDYYGYPLCSAALPVWHAVQHGLQSLLLVHLGAVLSVLRLYSFHRSVCAVV